MHFMCENKYSISFDDVNNGICDYYFELIGMDKL